MQAKTRLFALTAVLLCAAFALRAADQPLLDPNLEPLRPLLEKTWRGEFKNSTPEKPVVDIVRWERALNGKAVRSMHSINNGSYGGETIFRWDSTKKSIVFHYFTTAGFMTVGTVTFKDKVMTVHEEVKGNPGGVTEVRSTCEFLADGKFVVKAEHLKNGEWASMRETTYVEAPDAKIIFK